MVEALETVDSIHSPVGRAAYLARVSEHLVRIDALPADTQSVHDAVQDMHDSLFALNPHLSPVKDLFLPSDHPEKCNVGGWKLWNACWHGTHKRLKNVQGLVEQVDAVNSSSRKDVVGAHYALLAGMREMRCAFEAWHHLCERGNPHMFTNVRPEVQRRIAIRATELSESLHRTRGSLTKESFNLSKRATQVIAAATVWTPGLIEEDKIIIQSTQHALENDARRVSSGPLLEQSLSISTHARLVENMHEGSVRRFLKRIDEESGTTKAA